MNSKIYLVYKEKDSIIYNLKMESKEMLPVFGHLGNMERVVQPANFVCVFCEISRFLKGLLS